nr:FAD-binding oxidoreductase [Bacillus sp. PK3_68]
MVTDVETLAEDVALFRLQVDRTPVYKPGQYAILNLGDGLRRAYSMANLPESREVEFIARRYPNGIGSQKLFTLTPDTELTLDLPYGSAFLEDTSRPAVFIAGGTGISPILSMVRQMSLWGNSKERECTVFYGARTPKDLVMLNEVEQLLESIDKGTIIPVISKSSKEWNGEVGFVTDAMVRRLTEPWDKYEFYIAGPPVMVQAVRNLLDEREVDVMHVHYDSFG